MDWRWNMSADIKPGMRVRHRKLGEGTVVERVKDPCSYADYDALKICLVNFDKLPEGYGNPFLLDWEAVTPI